MRGYKTAKLLFAFGARPYYLLSFRWWRIAMAMLNTLATVWLVLLGVGLVQGQAPGDNDPICTEETIDGVQNPFFAKRPVYSASERPLMDSRNYNRLLQESGNAYIPWMSVDRDNNNTGDVVTEVRRQWFPGISSLISLGLCSGLNREQSHVRGQ